MEISDALASYTKGRISEIKSEKLRFVIERIIASLDDYVNKFTDEIMTHIKNVIQSWDYYNSFLNKKNDKRLNSYRYNPHRLNFFVSKVIKVHRARLNDEFKERLESLKTYLNSNVDKSNSNAQLNGNQDDSSSYILVDDIEDDTKDQSDQDEIIQLDSFIDFDYFLSKIKSVLDKLDKYFINFNQNPSITNPNTKPYQKSSRNNKKSSLLLNKKRFTDFNSDTECHYSSKYTAKKKQKTIFAKLKLLKESNNLSLINSIKDDDDYEESDEIQNISLQNSYSVNELDKLDLYNNSPFKNTFAKLNTDDISVLSNERKQTLNGAEDYEYDTPSLDESDESDDESDEEEDDEDSSDELSTNESGSIYKEVYGTGREDVSPSLPSSSNPRDSDSELIESCLENQDGDDECELESPDAEPEFIVIDDTLPVENQVTTTLNRPGSGKAKMKRIIEENIDMNKRNAELRKSLISLGMRVLALKDKLKHKWRLATITRIIEAETDIKTPSKMSDSTSQAHTRILKFNKLIKASRYIVVFDPDDEFDSIQPQAANTSYFLDDNYTEFVSNEENGEDAQQCVNEPDLNDSSETITDGDETASYEDNLNDYDYSDSESTVKKKRKLKKSQTNKKPNGVVKKRPGTNPAQTKSSTELGHIELAADSIAYLNGFDHIVPNCGYETKTNTYILPIRSRVVTYYELAVNNYQHFNNKYLIKSQTTLPYLFNSEYFCSGTIAELPALSNSYRYLIFYDNGTACYAKPNHIFPIFDLFSVPYDRLHYDHVKFLENYFELYPERSMVKVHVENSIQAYLFNKWYTCVVVDTDSSMVKLQTRCNLNEVVSFVNTSTTSAKKESNGGVGVNSIFSFWMYRGSFKLYPLYENFFKKLAENKLNGRRASDYESHIRSKLETLSIYDGYTNRYISFYGSTFFPPIDTKMKTLNILLKQIFETNYTSVISRMSRLNRDSVSSNSSNLREMELSKIIQGQVKLLDLEGLMRNEIIKFTPHPCTSSCISKYESDFTKVRSINPLLTPILHGWQRQICHQSKTISAGAKRWVNYITPCGRMIRNTNEVDRYLNFTNSKLTIDMFTFDESIRIDREYEANAKNLKIEDITDGKEPMPVSCVNCVDNTRPDKVDYSVERIPLEGVPLNTDQSNMEGCDCKDNCRDRSKCACWRKTFEATTLTYKNEMNTNVGYRDRRLPDIVNTGIFECNSSCKCDCRCSNRVVQNGLSVRLQLYKTSNKGWGLRCLDDIPKGTFICTYAGEIMTEEQSDIRGKELGDEYFAELDFVECLKKLREGYDTEMSDHHSNFNGNDFDDDSMSSSSRTSQASKKINNNNNNRSNEVYQRPKQQQSNLFKKNKTNGASSNDIEYIYLGSDQDEQDRSEENYEPTQQQRELNEKRQLIKQQKDKSMALTIDSNRFFTNRSNKYFFGEYLKDAQVYIMDAKKCGNIGRYFNHSCSPNIFVQNVFVDTYDFRFPWIAFFALTSIKAGTELCWDYNYTIDSVQGRKLFCYCNSTNCRGRLL